MNIDQLIDEMEVYIDNCKTTGMLSGGSMIKVNREELLAMLDELRAQLPRELAESRQIIETRESIITDARAKAEYITTKIEPTYTKTSLFLCEKRRFFMAWFWKGVMLISN